MSTTDLYLAADERARDARRAGLQAKKDEQPQNTARSYASKQREWKASIYSYFLSLLKYIVYNIGPTYTGIAIRAPEPLPSLLYLG